MRQPFLDHWDAKGNTPMLALNTTWVEKGSRFLVAPFEAYRPLTLYTKRAPPWMNWPRGDLHRSLKDISLSTAVGLSARFPFVLPAGIVADPSYEKRLLDGAIFENSGVETALDILEQLEEAIAERGRNAASDDKARPDLDVEMRLIIIGGAPSESKDVTVDQNGFLRELEPDRGTREDASLRLNTSLYEGSSEIMSPMRAMLRARVNRGQLAVQRAQRTLNIGGVERAKKLALPYEEGFGFLPLGWRLSASTQDLVAALIGDPQRCLSRALLEQVKSSISQGPPYRTRGQWALEAMNANNCRMCAILREVAPGMPVTDQDRPCG